RREHLPRLRDRQGSEVDEREVAVACELEQLREVALPRAPTPPEADRIITGARRGHGRAELCAFGVGWGVRRAARGELVPREAEVLDDPPADQVLLDDALDVRRRQVAVPRPLRIDDADRAGGADAEAVALRAVARP